MLRGYEVAPNQYVTVKSEELRQLRLPTSPTMEILRTTRLPEIDPLYFETSYYVVPERMGERAYALFYAALQETNYAALAKVAMHGREHIMLVRPGKKGLLAHTLYYNDELRADTEFAPDLSAVSQKELALAKTFVEAIAGPFAPGEFKDTYREQLQGLIAAKTARQKIAPAARVATSPSPVVDIMEALTKSLERAKREAPRHRPVAIRGKPRPTKASAEKHDVAAALSENEDLSGSPCHVGAVFPIPQRGPARMPDIGHLFSRGQDAPYRRDVGHHATRGVACIRRGRMGVARSLTRRCSPSACCLLLCHFVRPRHHFPMVGPGDLLLTHDLDLADGAVV